MPDRDFDIERICQAALDRHADERTALLAEVCGDDEALRREVESLLALEAAADRFLETPVTLVALQQRYTAGCRIGPYEIQSVLGAGGMGEVYRATDTKLGRQVAIKVLPQSFAANPERLARFEREARVLASLNHPNIAQIYGLEDHALVMELVEGHPMKGPLPLQTALDYARQIAGALEAAHEKGVVHRDLKPANLMTTQGGVVKVLDFGLASVVHSSVPDADPASQPASAPSVTLDGAIIGTAAYMSPEQANGKPADKRADVWSFGVVLWELLTGHRLFEGRMPSQTIAATVQGPIDFETLPADTPVVIRELLERCLERDVKVRLRDIGEARIQIDKYLSNPAGRLAIPYSLATQRAGWITAAIAVAIAGALGLARWSEPRPKTLERLRFQVAAPPQTTVSGGPVLSPDSRWIAFTARGADGRGRLWVHSFDIDNSRALPGTEDAFNPVFWSPDSRFIAFAKGTSLQKIAVAGGTPLALCDRCGPGAIGSRVFRGGAWSAAGVIVYAVSSNGLWRIPDVGGAPARISPMGNYGYPAFLPDGHHFLYTLFANAPEPGVYVGSVNNTPDRWHPTRLIEGALVLSTYAPSDNPSEGHLLTLREGTLSAQPFDTTTLELSGEATPIAENVPAVNPPAAFSSSLTGVLAFSTLASADTSRLIWLDRTGKQLGQLGPPSYYANVSVSPDGKQFVVDRVESDRRTRRAWSADSIRGVLTPLTSTATSGWSPAVWSDGSVAFTSERDLYLTTAGGAGDSELVFRSPNLKHANDWSPDGRFLVYDEHHPTQRQDLWLLPLAGDRRPIPLVVTAADEAPAQFSPDGKWIAYSSDESGTSEVYVRDFAPSLAPAVGAIKTMVSVGGGDKPQWRQDGSELYYIALNGMLMAVPLKMTQRLTPGLPAPLFPVNIPAGSFFPYAVADDGRFLVNMLAEPTAPSTPITVLLNWAAPRRKD